MFFLYLYITKIVKKTRPPFPGLLYDLKSPKVTVLKSPKVAFSVAIADYKMLKGFHTLKLPL